MSKREQHVQRIKKIKEHIRDVPMEELVKRYKAGYLGKEGAIATREILMARGEADRIHR